MRAALEHAIVRDHVCTTIVGHSFELANRSGLLANRVHVSRFKALCLMLAQLRERAPTVHFADHPNLRLDSRDTPLAANRWRRSRRQLEQLWSNLVAERGA